MLIVTDPTPSRSHADAHPLLDPFPSRQVPSCARRVNDGTHRPSPVNEIANRQQSDEGSGVVQGLVAPAKQPSAIRLARHVAKHSTTSDDHRSSIGVAEATRSPLP